MSEQKLILFQRLNLLIGDLKLKNYTYFLMNFERVLFTTKYLIFTTIDIHGRYDRKRHYKRQLNNKKNIKNFILFNC